MRYNIDIPRCAKCIMPESEGHICFNDEGVCNVCLSYEKLDAVQETFDQLSDDKKLEMLKKKTERFKGKGEYDCAVAVSGGKDSIMTLYIAVKQLGLKPLAIFVDNGFALDEMYDNVKNATDILGVDLIVYKTSDMIKMLPVLLKSKKRLYYCRICHALLDRAILSLCKKYEIKLVLGGYTKGQQYIRNKELFWIYDESDKNIVELLSEMPEFRHLAPMYQNQHKYFYDNYGNIMQISPFKYVQWDEENIIRIITEELKWKMPKRSWPDKSSNCMFNYVAQYLAEKQFGYAQHESELSWLVRDGEISRDRAKKIIESPIEDTDMIKALEKINMSIDEII